jgi:hypothetical protein
MQSHLINRATPVPREMTAEQLRYLGTREVVYLKALKPGLSDHGPAFIIYGADGTPLETADSIEMAVARVLENGLSFVAIH